MEREVRTWRIEEVEELVATLAPLLQNLEKEDSKWVGLEGCARRLGITVPTLRTKIWAWKKGILERAAPIGTDITPYHPRGISWRFEKAEIDRYIKRGRVE